MFILLFFVIIYLIDNQILAFFHQPFWRTRGATDAYGLHSLEPSHIYLARVFYLLAVGIHPQALIKQHLAITALAT
jgi:hypothetical protein